MTKYETIKEVRRLLKLNGGLTAKQIALVMGVHTNHVLAAIKVMGDAYIDRWVGDVGVYELQEKPENCPKPNRKATA